MQQISKWIDNRYDFTLHLDLNVFHFSGVMLDSCDAEFDLGLEGLGGREGRRLRKWPRRKMMSPLMISWRLAIIQYKIKHGFFW